MKGAVLLALLLLACGVGHAESIPLKQEHGAFVVPVLINDAITLNFTIDSGASDVSVPADVLSTLIRAGTVLESDMLEKHVYMLADGSKQELQRFRIRSLKVGSLELKDVNASVAPKEGSLLLGQSFLSRLPSWSIDNRKQVLRIGKPSPAYIPLEDLAEPNSAPATDARQRERTIEGWLSIGGPDDESYEDLVQTSSIRVKGHIRQAWIKQIFKPHTERGSLDNSEKWVLYTMQLQIIDCVENTYTFIALNYYFEDGSVDRVDVAATDASTHWDPIPPDTMVDSERDFVCSWKPK